jgi:monothiol glutaredoxin
MSRDIMTEIKEEVGRSKILIYMKGNRLFPQCGFSAATIKAFEQLEVPFETVDILEDPEKRQAIKEFSSWPTIPQVYIAGEFVGGWDIIRELFERGELQAMAQAAVQPES